MDVNYSVSRIFTWIYIVLKEKKYIRTYEVFGFQYNAEKGIILLYGVLQYFKVNVRMLKYELRSVIST